LSIVTVLHARETTTLAVLSEGLSAELKRFFCANL